MRAQKVRVIAAGEVRTQRVKTNTRLVAKLLVAHCLPKLS